MREKGEGEGKDYGRTLSQLHIACHGSSITGGGTWLRSRGRNFWLCVESTQTPPLWQKPCSWLSSHSQLS